MKEGLVRSARLMMFAFFVSTILVMTLHLPAYSETMSESGKIEYLIKKIEGLEGAVFVRNGTDHSPKEAADHMRLKLEKAGSRIKSAPDFIKYCGTGSSITGEPYKIRFRNGTEKPSAEVLEAFLKELEQSK